MPQQHEMLYTMRQLSHHCGRSLQLIREYYADGVLPDPRYTKKHDTTQFGKIRKTRKFTMLEMDQIKNFFDSVKRGTIKTVKKRAERRERLENAASQNRQS